MRGAKDRIIQNKVQLLMMPIATTSSRTCTKPIVGSRFLLEPISNKSAFISFQVFLNEFILYLFNF
ncbi:hypothetical protein SY85_05300 [Flavisolibacter tropicus]|uniref:Uncharacterized protein n=1 Tax=Flavisolibacter tropicus TaxID=1492898 RepID=A0A172TSP5_9BACT|nr:hypothetical protein SY85_05300 [Flavisolibacter tropicus]